VSGQDLPYSLDRAELGHGVISMSSSTTRPNTSERYAFISYSRADRSRVMNEVSAIRARGFPVWIDDAIRPTAEWPDEIGMALQGCSLFVLFVTPNAIESRNVRNEVNLAIDESKPVLVIYLEKTDLSLGLRLRLGDVQAVHKLDLLPERYTQLLSETLTSALGGDPIPQPEPSPAEQAGREDLDFGQLGL